MKQETESSAEQFQHMGGLSTKIKTIRPFFFKKLVIESKCIIQND